MLYADIGPLVVRDMSFLVRQTGQVDFLAPHL
jgi:hypothetical protein